MSSETQAMAVKMTRYGEPDVLTFAAVVLPPLDPGEVRITQTYKRFGAWLSRWPS